MANRIRYERNSKRSSEAARQEARASVQELNTREEEIKKRQHELRGWPERLTEAARFVVDVGADETAMGQLATATQEAEEALAISDERRDIVAERKHLNGQSFYFQHRATRLEGVNGPFPYNLVLAEADTLKELKAKVRALWKRS